MDLFRRALLVVENMGVLAAVCGKVTGTHTVVPHRGNAKPITVDLRKVVPAVSDNHVEIIRDDSSEIVSDTCLTHGSARASLSLLVAEVTAARQEPLI
ncbi:MAG TPA: hypothetical protein VMU34_06445 [Mycobacterium sp.]|nr:hypothetical protein [Mycobacterium sp.]